MAIDYERLKARAFPEIRHVYGERDTILYALGVGLGHDPVDDTQLRFTVEGRTEFALPTFALVMGYPGVWVMEPDTGIDWRKVVNGEQGVVWHKPVRRSAVTLGRTRIEEIVDKGSGKGALIYAVRDVFDESTGDLLCSVSQTLFCRGDGGFGGPSVSPRRPQPVPSSPPDLVHDFPTVPQAALIYRLSGDMNPLHADPQAARSAGYARPILHGAASFGIAGFGLLKMLCAGEPQRLREMKARFSAPVFPGETVRTEIWRLGEDEFAFRCRVRERDVVAVDNGSGRLGA